MAAMKMMWMPEWGKKYQRRWPIFCSKLASG